jgi:hypothetical protein
LSTSPRALPPCTRLKGGLPMLRRGVGCFRLGRVGVGVGVSADRLLLTRAGCSSALCVRHAVEGHPCRPCVMGRGEPRAQARGPAGVRQRRQEAGRQQQQQQGAAGVAYRRCMLAPRLAAAAAAGAVGSRRRRQQSFACKGLSPLPANEPPTNALFCAARKSRFSGAGRPAGRGFPGAEL